MSKHVTNQFHSRERGQSLTEMAIMLPVLVVLIVGAIDLGRAYFAYVGITNAAREGARYGIVNPAQSNFGSYSSCPGTPPNPMTIRYRVCEEVQGSGITVANPNTDVIIECSAISPEAYSAAKCDDVSVGDKIRVTIHYGFSLVSTQAIGLSSVPMQNWATMSIINGNSSGQ